ncbi:hypothetical protein JTE90_001866 [Oedothorax gibbosus]|uniref:Uncharacterized protein n=1 Tax=Oedothorax gibbosus TaxID=931172 RepID=A0AAV6VP32_9ARAC|nr:hypothetical protein JTE90_001866 [Oedothorax gibbosus]
MLRASDSDVEHSPSFFQNCHHWDDDEADDGWHPLPLTLARGWQEIPTSLPSGSRVAAWIGPETRDTQHRTDYFSKPVPFDAEPLLPKMLSHRMSALAPTMNKEN